MNEPVQFVEGTFGLTEIPRHRPEPSEQGRSVFELAGDEMDDLGLALHLAVTPMSLAPSTMRRSRSKRLLQMMTLSGPVSSSGVRNTTPPRA
ncbi:MAG: hypothetical protein ACT4QB_02480 [Gammaproteobacteria bacterium]